MNIEKLTRDSQEYRMREIQWLMKHGFDPSFLDNKSEEASELISDKIKLDTVNLLPKTFYHNRIDGVSRKFAPYNERLYLQILKEYMKKRGIKEEQAMTPREEVAVMKKIVKAKNKSIVIYLKSLNFGFYKIRLDGNSAAKAVSKYRKGTTGSHKVVR